MTKTLFKPTFNGGSMQRLPTVANKTIEAEYYRGREAEQIAKKAIDKAKKAKPKRGQLVIDDRMRQIAQDFRKLPKGRVMLMHNLSRATTDKILGEMDLGNL